MDIIQSSPPPPKSPSPATSEFDDEEDEQLAYVEISKPPPPPASSTTATTKHRRSNSTSTEDFDRLRPPSFGSFSSNGSPPPMLYKKHNQQQQHPHSLADIRRVAEKHKVTLKDIVSSFGLALKHIVANNDRKLVRTSNSDLAKWANNAESVSVDLVKYIWQIVDAFNANKEPLFLNTNCDMVDEQENPPLGRGLRCLLSSLFYLERMAQPMAGGYSPFLLTSRNAHLCILGVMAISHKFSDDSCFKMRNLALLGGVSVDNLRKMEASICIQIKFDFFIAEEQFNQRSLLQLHSAVRGAANRVRKRGGGEGLVRDGLPYGLGGSTPILGGNNNRNPRKKL